MNIVKVLKGYFCINKKEYMSVKKDCLNQKYYVEVEYKKKKKLCYMCFKFDVKSMFRRVF